jgi:hypothetical protein
MTMLTRYRTLMCRDAEQAARAGDLAGTRPS